MSSHYTVPGMSDKQGAQVAAMLQKQLSRYNDLHLTLKHVHWNVIGPNFIAVHQMIDPQVALVRGYADEVAERIATLGGSPKGTPARSSTTAPGLTTRAIETVPTCIWPRSSGSTAGLSRTRAKTSGAYRIWMWLPKTPSSGMPASSRSFSGSCGRTWKRPAASSAGLPGGPRNYRREPAPRRSAGRVSFLIALRKEPIEVTASAGR